MESLPALVSYDLGVSHLLCECLGVGTMTVYFKNQAAATALHEGSNPASCFKGAWSEHKLPGSSGDFDGVACFQIPSRAYVTTRHLDSQDRAGYIQRSNCCHLAIYRLLQGLGSH